jgi:NADPH-dependent curcumin reductase CurA
LKTVEKSSNRQWILTSRPAGRPTPENFQLVETSIPPLEKNQVLVQTVYLSVDPYMRPRMRNVRSYVAPFGVGEVLDGGVAGRILDSKHPGFSVGDLVNGRMGWQDYSVVSGDKLRKLPPDESLLSASLGVLGMTGLTAYFALLDLGRPKAGETVLISGAAGAVGSIAGQITKIKGARAVGIVGSDEKVRFLKEECGFAAAVNYKTADNLRKGLKEACPNGVDIYFDNVGGPTSDAAITLINLKARIIICGQISLYNLETPAQGPRNLAYLLVARARMEGFLVHDYESRYEEGLRELKTWLDEKKLTHRETVAMGLEKAPEAFLGLFEGKNIGKQLVKVS